MSRRILIVRRENIGDLVLTTPLIRALRQAMPEAHLAALVNSYNAPVLEGNADLDAVYVYTKGKHAGSPIAALQARLAQAWRLWQLRRQHFDDVLLPDPRYSLRNIRLARFVLAGRPNTQVIGFEDTEGGNASGLDVVISKADTDQLHQAQFMFLAVTAFGIDTPPANTPPCVVFARKRSVATTDQPTPRAAPISIGLHISARKPSQRWPAASFVALARLIQAHDGARLKLFWSPGATDDLLHPGDDTKAAQILAAFATSAQPQAAGRPAIEPMPTASLRELIDSLSEVDMLVCADGGALHIGAGLGKPIVALFGDSETKRWHPWGVPFRTLQKPSLDVADIPVDEVFAAVMSLRAECHA